MPKINLAVVFGGKSGEHEVSISTALAVIKAIDKDKYNIIPIAITKQGNWLLGNKGEEYLRLHQNAAGQEGAISQKQSQSLVSENSETTSLTNYIEGEASAKNIDLVMPLIHGQFGEDGKIQGMFDMLGIPYLFSGCLPSALAMNKYYTKIIAREAGLNIAKEIIIDRDDSYNVAGIVDILDLPIVVKPLELGSSVGINVADSNEKLEKGIKEAFKHGYSCMLEKFIKGRELSVGVLGSRKEAEALPVIEIKPKVSGWFDYKAKYEKGGSEEVCPAEIPDTICEQAQKMAVEIFKELNCKDLARVDFIWGQSDNKLYFLEINTIPGMTPTSLVPQEAKAAGMEFSAFIDKLIKNALNSHVPHL